MRPVIQPWKRADSMNTTSTLKLPPVYIANVEAEEEGGYSVSFPDLEGCFTQGDTFEDAVRYAADAAAQWLEAHGSYPKPSNPTETTAAIIKVGGIPAAIEPPALKARTVPVTISLLETVLRRIDTAAEMQGMTRSAFISTAALQAAGFGPDVQRTHEMIFGKGDPGPAMVKEHAARRFVRKASPAIIERAASGRIGGKSKSGRIGKGKTKGLHAK